MHGTPKAFIALRTLLRSLGQVVLQPNAVTGACMFAAWLACDRRLAFAALLGAVTANIGAAGAGLDAHDSRIGLHGFNGALASLLAFTFIPTNITATAIAILASTGPVCLLGPWTRWLRSHGLCAYSSPCLIATWIWLPAVNTVTPVAPNSTAHAFTLTNATSVVLAGLAQTGFASGALSGLFVLAGIAAASRRAACWALAGAAIASGSQLLLDAGATSFSLSLSGFNGALAALALAECGVIATLGGIALSVALQQLAGHYGLPALSAPFVVAAWVVQLVNRRLRAATVGLSSSPP
ncbi:urea transporter [Paraburkholderia sp. EG287A]|uniref:urea transporter n=1 Tax=unclassified Paraburkholderia TaxID=2615204 RepID=UPI0034D1FF07